MAKPRVFYLLVLAMVLVVVLSNRSGSHSGEGNEHHHGHGNKHGHHSHHGHHHHGHHHGHGHGNKHHHHHGHGHSHKDGQDGHHHPSHGHKKHHVHFFQDNIDLDRIDAHELKDSFKEWKKVFGKTYTSSSEEAAHYQTYLSNWKKIIQFNKNQNETFKMGMNQFSDLTTRQFSEFIGSCFKGGAPRKLWREKVDVSAGGVSANPASVDWTTKGVVTPVKNQGQCGSCWAFSTTGSLECRAAIKTGKLVSLSEQQLVDCSRAEGNLGCNGGLMDDAFKYIKKEGGLCSESEYPYKARDGTCKAASCGTKFDSITGYTDVPKDSAPDLETAVVQGCVSVAIEADQSAFQFYKSGILSGRCGTRLDHGVLVVGYGEEGEKKYWKVKNSWGQTWGEQGYVRICKECGKDFGKGECGILEQPSYPTV